jgi:hypothetical protein
MLGSCSRWGCVNCWNEDCVFIGNVIIRFIYMEYIYVTVYSFRG